MIAQLVPTVPQFPLHPRGAPRVNTSISSSYVGAMLLPSVGSPDTTEGRKNISGTWLRPGLCSGWEHWVLGLVLQGGRRLLSFQPRHCSLMLCWWWAKRWVGSWLPSPSAVLIPCPAAGARAFTARGQAMGSGGLVLWSLTGTMWDSSLLGQPLHLFTLFLLFIFFFFARAY